MSAAAMRWNVSETARQFIAGRNPHDVIATLRKRRAQKIGFTVDVLGEAVVSEAEADEYAARYADLLDKLARETKDWTDPLGKSAELFPVLNLSVKISALYSQMSPAAPADAIAHLCSKLRPLLRRARELGAFINFDMESYALKNTTLELFKTTLTEAEFKDWPHAGIAIQAYLRDSEHDLRDLIEWGRARGTRFAVRLVKGAYWDYETTKSGQNGSNPPVFLQKPESDANFEELTRVLFENEAIVTAAFGSHNVRSIAHAQAVADELRIDRSRFEFQLLYGMAGPIKRALVGMGYRVREYCPIGELLPGMAYLVRRLLENTSNEGFLRAKFAENVPAKELLRDPKELIKPAVASIAGSNQKNGASLRAAAGDIFRNAPLVSFIYKDSQDKMESALREERKRLGEKHPLYIGGEKIWTDHLTPSVNPAEPTEIVGYGTEAGVDEAERAVKAARAAFEKWRWTPFEERAQLLERAADIMEPSEQSIICGAMLMQVFEEAGVPPGVLNFLSGHGSVVGAHLVDHKDVDLVAFTGSREVGLKIWESAGITRPGQRELKRVICEMGGKNAMIVDADADLDETITNSIYSAFGFQGQKCSALSRLILLEENYDRVIERLIPAATSLRIGNPEEPGIMVGPVIDEPAYRRILEYIEIGKKEATLAYQAKEVPPHGYFIPPTIFSDVRPDMRIAREEIFGPVLSVLKVRDLDEALEVANGTDYALTGGFFSRSPDNIERVKARLEAGNVYINRSCTGAIVGRHPFGGFKMSGSGTKAGGEDYLLHFLVPRVVTENTSRHGFAPEQ